MTFFSTRATAAALGVSFTVSPMAAFAVPMHWTFESGGNGHYYEFQMGADTWDHARYNTVAFPFLGWKGYMATITSAAEADFIHSVMGGIPGWAGGRYNATKAQWEWVDGPEAGTAFTYTNWVSGEPDNSGDYLLIHYNGNGWSNTPDLALVDGWYIEYDTGSRAEPLEPVPLPAALPLLAAAFGALCLARRRGA